MNRIALRTLSQMAAKNDTANALKDVAKRIDAVKERANITREVCGIVAMLRQHACESATMFTA